MYKSGNFCTRGTFEHVLPKLYDILPQVFTGICKLSVKHISYLHWRRTGLMISHYCIKLARLLLPTVCSFYLVSHLMIMS